MNKRDYLLTNNQFDDETIQNVLKHYNHRLKAFNLMKTIKFGFRLLLMKE